MSLKMVKQFQPNCELGIIIYTTISIAPSILVDTAIMLNETLPSRIKFHIMVFDHNLNNYTYQIFNILRNQDSTEGSTTLLWDFIYSEYPLKLFCEYGWIRTNIASRLFNSIKLYK